MKRQLTKLGLLKVALTGATLGSLMDAFHTYGGATSYPDPVLLRAAWWTPLIFTAAYLSIALVYVPVHMLFKSPLPNGKQQLGGVLFFAGLYFASGFLPFENPAKALVLVTGALGLLAFVDRSKAAIVCGVTGALIGPVTEIILTKLGLFAHLQPDFMRIPMWLPALYFASGPGLGGFLAHLGTQPAKA
jgi:hypothetical protein